MPQTTDSYQWETLSDAEIAALDILDREDLTGTIPESLVGLWVRLADHRGLLMVRVWWWRDREDSLPKAIQAPFAKGDVIVWDNGKQAFWLESMTALWRMLGRAKISVARYLHGLEKEQDSVFTISKQLEREQRENLRKSAKAVPMKKGAKSVKIAPQSSEILTTGELDGLTVLKVQNSPLGINLEARGHEVRKLLWAGFGGKMLAGGHDPEDVYQEVMRGLVARNAGKCPWDETKSSFGHYVHLVINGVLINYHKKQQQVKGPEVVGWRDRDGVVKDVAVAMLS